MFSQLLKRLAGPALTLGGLFWVLAAISSVIVGILTGKVNPFPDTHSPALVYIGVWVFPLAILPLGVGLLGVFARLEGRARVAGITGVVLTSIGMVLSIGALISIFAGNNILDSSFGGLGSFAIIIGSGFLGLAALRAHVLPRWMAVTLLIFGFVTVPFIFVTPLPIGPAWATDFLGFFLIAIVYIVAGVTLIMTRKHAEYSKHASINMAVEAR